MKKRLWMDQPWDVLSDQPDRLRVPKGPLRRLAVPEYAAMAVTAVLGAPLVIEAWSQVVPGPVPAWSDFLGVAVTPSGDPGRDRDLLGRVLELGVRRTLLRIPVWERARLPAFVRFAEALRIATGQPVLFSVLQDRGSVASPHRWRLDLASVFAACGPLAEAFQILQAPNRTKWGCWHAGDALRLLEDAERVRRGFPGVRLAGPGVIDFEPLPAMRLLLNHRRFRLDIHAALLYVDRRGAPTNTQYGVFDLARKIRFLAALGRASARCRTAADTPSPLWITEFNWPLAGQGAWAPTSPHECVSPDVAADYTEAYLRIARDSGLVERAYHWQLCAQGYGLVDRHLVPRPAFHRLQALLAPGAR